MPGKLDLLGDAVRQTIRQYRQPSSPRMLDAVREVADGDSNAARMAEDLLQQRNAMELVDQFLGDHRLRLGRHIGSGAESVVWEAAPIFGNESHVLKVRPDGMATDFDAPDDVPGIAPYWAKEQAGPNVAVALQQKAHVYEPRRGLEKPFALAADRVQQSLLARGWHWGDNHKWNVGVMPDGTWGAIDGFIDKAHPSWSLPPISEEEAIRMLRITPEERASVFGVGYAGQP